MSTRVCLVYYLRECAAPERTSVAWCQQSRRTPEGLGEYGNASACHTPSGTTGDARGTGHFHSPTTAGAAETQHMNNYTPAVFTGFIYFHLIVKKCVLEQRSVTGSSSMIVLLKLERNLWGACRWTWNSNMWFFELLSVTGQSHFTILAHCISCLRTFISQPRCKLNNWSHSAKLQLFHQRYC